MTLLDKALEEAKLLLAPNMGPWRSPEDAKRTITHCTIHADALRELYEAASKYRDLCD